MCQTKQPIDPIIYINKPNWKKHLFAYFHYDELAQAIEEIWSKDPNEFY